MGLDLCWIGVDAGRRKQLLDWFGLEPAGEVADQFGAAFVLTETPDGWAVLAARESGFNLDEALVGVSASCGAAVGGCIIEGATFSRTCGAHGGRKLWSVTHGDREGGGLTLGGELPPEFASIEARRVAEQGSVENGYLFETPIALGADITGYRPEADQGLEWTALTKKEVTRQAGARRRPPSLREAMLTELVPLLLSLGWETPDRPTLADGGQIRRKLGDVEQSIWFDYGSGQETYIIVWFYAGCGEAFEVNGSITTPGIRLPVWRRFTWKRFVELSQYEPPKDIIRAVIDRARDHIRIADEYLRDWSPNSGVLINFAYPRAKWPTPPGAAAREDGLANGS